MIFTILTALNNDSSRLAKEKILMDNKDNTLLKTVIVNALDSLTQFYIRKIPEYTASGSNTLEWGINELTKLSSRQLTGHAGIAHLKFILESLNSNDAKVIEYIIEKDLKCGVSIVTVNKVWKDLVYDYPCMLCSPLDDKTIAKFKFPAIAQLKLDGARFNAIVYNGSCDFRTRNGKSLNFLGKLEQEFIDLANGQNVVFDGELLVRNENGVADRKTGNGILAKAKSANTTITEAEADLICATVWDYIPYDALKQGVYKTPYETRYNQLKSLTFNSNKITLVETTTVNSLDEANALFNKYLQEGQEGLILKDLSGIWENKRVKTQLKMKGEFECDLKVIDIQEGTGKYAGMIGALICQTKDGEMTVAVGSGLNDNDRSKSHDTYLNKIIAVKYNAKITNKKGTNSLFLPIFIEVRDDKDIADSFADMQ